MSDLRAKLRSLTVGAKKKFKSELVEWEGEQFEVRQPSVTQRSAIMQNAQEISMEEGEQRVKVDYAKMQIWSVICCTYVPGDDTPLYTEADYEVMSSSPASSYVDKLSAIATKLMNASPEEVAKNFDVIPSDSSSSESQKQ